MPPVVLPHQSYHDAFRETSNGKRILQRHYFVIHAHFSGISDGVPAAKAARRRIEPIRFRDELDKCRDRGWCRVCHCPLGYIYSRQLSAKCITDTAVF